MKQLFVIQKKLFCNENELDNDKKSILESLDDLKEETSLAQQQKNTTLLYEIQERRENLKSELNEIIGFNLTPNSSLECTKYK